MSSLEHVCEVYGLVTLLEIPLLVIAYYDYLTDRTR